MKNNLLENINKLPNGASLNKKEGVWTGVINSKEVEEPVIGPISNPNLGTVIEHLVILMKGNKIDG